MYLKSKLVFFLLIFVGISPLVGLTTVDMAMYAINHKVLVDSFTELDKTIVLYTDCISPVEQLWMTPNSIRMYVSAYVHLLRHVTVYG